MKYNLVQELRAKEGAVVQITSTEGEVLRARVFHVSEEAGDVAIDILSTNQPERYEQMDRSYNEVTWVMPFEFIAGVEPVDQRDSPAV